MLWIHPILQIVVTVAAFYVFYLGLQRFRSAHLGHKTVFLWKRHAIMGRLVILGWIIGLLLGMMVVNAEFGMTGIFADHFHGSMIMTPLMLFGFITGAAMDRHRKKRTALPLVHALNNVALLGTALYQVYTGWFIFSNIVLA